MTRSLFFRKNWAFAKETQQSSAQGQSEVTIESTDWATTHDKNDNVDWRHLPWSGPYDAAAVPPFALLELKFLGGCGSALAKSKFLCHRNTPRP
jgi:hypothetical protein